MEFSLLRPLVYTAIEKGSTEVFKLLLEKNIITPNERYEAPLPTWSFLKAAHGSKKEEIQDLLIDAGAEIVDLDRYGFGMFLMDESKEKPDGTSDKLLEKLKMAALKEYIKEEDLYKSMALNGLLERYPDFVTTAINPETKKTLQ